MQKWARMLVETGKAFVDSSALMTKMRGDSDFWSLPPLTVSQLVSWCFEPSQPQRITSGLNTNFTPYPSHSFHWSSYHKSCFQHIYIPRALNTGTCIQQGDLFYSAGLHRNNVLATADTGEIGRGFGKNAGKWTGSVEISKEEIPGSRRSMYGLILTYSRL